MTRIYNFSSGPAVLPEPVLRRAQAAIWDLDGTGIGILEHSHRSTAFMAVLERTEARLRALAGIPDTYAVLFLQGGASTQFFQVPMNFLAPVSLGTASPSDGHVVRTADYCHTGVWSKKAIAEAKRYGGVHVACSSEADQFTYIPSAAQTSWSSAPAYVHFTSNNTIYGTEWASEPAVPAGVPLVCDASSDIFSRPIDIARYAMIYAGAQKNLGPAGVTLVIIRKDFLESGGHDLPTMLQYRTHAGEQSMFNTPPTFGIYVVGEVAAWIEEQGGLVAMAEHNRAKARILYDYLDQSKLVRGTVRSDSRSLMNVVFRCHDPSLEPALIAEATSRGLDGLKGHRTVGGMRASMYNAFPLDGVHALVAFLREFESTHG